MHFKNKTKLLSIQMLKKIIKVFVETFFVMVTFMVTPKTAHWNCAYFKMIFIDFMFSIRIDCLLKVVVN